MSGSVGWAGFGLELHGYALKKQSKAQTRIFRCRTKPEVKEAAHGGKECAQEYETQPCEEVPCYWWHAGEVYVRACVKFQTGKEESSGQPQAVHSVVVVVVVVVFVVVVVVLCVCACVCLCFLYCL